MGTRNARDRYENIKTGSLLFLGKPVGLLSSPRLGFGVKCSANVRDTSYPEIGAPIWMQKSRLVKHEIEDVLRRTG